MDWVDSTDFWKGPALHRDLKFLQLADPSFHHSAELLDFVCGATSRAKRIANLLQRRPSPQIPNPPGIFA